jgi:segregation and condensation protein B
MDASKKTIEAALFISGRWMRTEDLSRIVGSGSVGAVKEALKELKKEYDERMGGIRMVERDGSYRFEINPEVRDKVYYLAPEPELSPALIKTLALIAYKQPVYQSKVVEVIGNRAYEYIKELRKKEFIAIKKKGRTKLISTTGHFRKYFAIPEGGEWRPDLGGEGKILEEAQRKLDDVMEDVDGEDAKNKALIEEGEEDNDGKAKETQAQEDTVREDN